jgi:anaerobic magnesium-protoporphyrin IX monomethyl ester cyclase
VPGRKTNSPLYSKLSSLDRPYIVFLGLSLKYNFVNPVVKPRAMTMDQVMKKVLESYRRFYMDKMKRLDEMDEFKKEYMLNELTTQILIQH